MHKGRRKKAMNAAEELMKSFKKKVKTIFLFEHFLTNCKLLVGEF